MCIRSLHEWRNLWATSCWKLLLSMWWYGVWRWCLSNKWGSFHHSWTNFESFTIQAFPCKNIEISLIVNRYRARNKLCRIHFILVYNILKLFLSDYFKNYVHCQTLMSAHPLQTDTTVTKVQEQPVPTAQDLSAVCVVCPTLVLEPWAPANVCINSCLEADQFCFTQSFKKNYSYEFPNNSSILINAISFVEDLLLWDDYLSGSPITGIVGPITPVTDIPFGTDEFAKSFYVSTSDLIRNVTYRLFKVTCGYLYCLIISTRWIKGSFVW